MQVFSLTRMSGSSTAGKSLGLSAVVLFSAFLFGGCSPQLDRIELAVQKNHDAITKLEAENKRTMTQVKALGEFLRLDTNAGDETSAMRAQRLLQVSQQLDQMMHKLEDNAEYMRNISARVDLLATRGGTVTLGDYKPPANNSDGNLMMEAGKSILDAAVLDKNQGNSELARMGFQDYLKDYGMSESADDALYYLGELDMADGQAETALGSFQKLVEDFPNSEFVPAALYKSRTCLLDLDRKEEAWAMGGDLITRFPQSPEAALLQAEKEDADSSDQ
jgi:TolA-binding protein